MGSGYTTSLNATWEENIVGTTYYEGNPTNKYITNNGDGHSMSIKTLDGPFRISILGVIQLNNIDSVARELYLAIRVNGQRVSENYFTANSTTPQIQIVTFCPYYECKGGEQIDMSIYSNNAGNVKVEEDPTYIKGSLTIRGVG